MGTSDDALVGTSVGSFRIERVLGRGAMGTVYYGVHGVIGSKVAIKVLHLELSADKKLVARFQDEARAVNLIGHENIVSVFDLNVLPSGQPYLVMEYLEGRPLGALLEAPMDPRVLVSVLIQVCAGLHAAHQQGVVHRDLKPDNIFLLDRPGRAEPVVKLLDFGVAKLLESQESHEKTAAGMILGTPAYMAPEQWGNQEVDARSDLYSLGVTAWRALTGRVPFKGKTLVDILMAHRTEHAPSPHDVNPSIPEALSQVVMTAMAKEPWNRYATALDMQRALEDVARGQGWVAGPSGDGQDDELPRIKLLGDKGEELRRFTFADLTRGGVFLHCEPPYPELFYRLPLELSTPKGPLQVQGEVVRHVSPEQARAWGMKPGLGVQFVALNDDAKKALREWLGAPSREVTVKPQASNDEAWARHVDSLLESWVEHGYGNHYQVLKVRMDATADEIRAAASRMVREFASDSSTQLTQTQAMQVRGAMERIRNATKALLDPKLRAAYDADLGNFRGVAQAFASGLTRTDADELREQFLATRSQVRATAELAINTADPLMAAGMREVAQALYERGLQQDPLNWQLHERYRRARDGSANGVSAA